MKLRPSHPSLRIGKPRRRALYALLLLLVLTGAIWLLLHKTRSEDAMPSPLEPWLMKLHGAMAMLMTFVAGTLLYGHILNAWHQRRNRFAGTITALGFLSIALSGYGLYYFDGELVRQITEWLHWIVGFGLPALLWWHIVCGRKAGRAQAGAGQFLS